MLEREIMTVDEAFDHVLEVSKNRPLNHEAAQELINNSDLNLPELLIRLAGNAGATGVHQSASVLIHARPEAAENALDSFALSSTAWDRDVKIELLDTLYAVCPDYDVNVALTQLAEKNVFVRRAAKAILLTHPRRKNLSFAASNYPWSRLYGRNGYYGAEADATDLAKLIENAAATPIVFDKDEVERRGLRRACEYALAQGPDRRSVSWAFPYGFPEVLDGTYHRTDEDDNILANQLLRNCYFMTMLNAASMEMPPLAEAIEERLNRSSLEACSFSILRMWEENGSEANLVGMLLYCCRHMPKWGLPALAEHIEKLDQNGRSELAAAARKMLQGR